MNARRTSTIIGSILSALAAVLVVGLFALVTTGLQQPRQYAVPPTVTPTTNPMDNPSGGGPGPETIQRQAEFAYPNHMDGVNPATVRLSIFSGDYKPLALPDSSAPQAVLSIPALRDLKPRLNVKLELSGAQVVRETSDPVQPLYDTVNTWEWQIAAVGSQPVTVRPQIHVEYTSSAGVIESSYDVPWKDAYTISNVTPNSQGSTIGDWLSRNVLSLLSIIIGVPGSALALHNLRKSTQMEPAPAR